MSENEKFFSFMRSAVVPESAVEECGRMLRESGFIRLSPDESFRIETGGKYYIKLFQGALAAFVMPTIEDRKQWKLHCVCAHTDSPGFRIKICV